MVESSLKLINVNRRIFCFIKVFLRLFFIGNGIILCSIEIFVIWHEWRARCIKTLHKRLILDFRNERRHFIPIYDTRILDRNFLSLHLCEQILLHLYLYLFMGCCTRHCKGSVAQNGKTRSEVEVLPSISLNATQVWEKELKYDKSR